MKRLVICLVAGILLLALGPALWAALAATGPVGPVQAPSAFAEGRENASLLRQALAAEGRTLRVITSSLAALEDAEPASSLLIVYARRTAPDAREEAALDAYRARGGSIWVAASNEAFNAWLAPARAAIAVRPLLDPRGADPSLVALESPDPTVGGPVYAQSPGLLVLEQPSQWTPWLVAGAAVHLDLDRNGTVDAADLPGPHLVAAAQVTPQGALLIVSADSSLLTDAAWTRPAAENAAFVRWAVSRALPPDGVVLLDESDRGASPPERPWIQSARASHQLRSLPLPAVLALLAVAALGAVPIWSFTAPLRPFPPHEPRDASASAPAAAPRTDLARRVAWELLSRRTGVPVPQLQATGAQEAISGLNEDPRVARALQGDPTPQDEAALLDTFLKETGGKNP